MTGDSTSRPDPYRELFERSADAILIIEGDRFVECNDAAVAMLQCASREEVLRLHPSEISPPTQPDGRDSFEKANEYMGIAFSKGSHRFEWAHRRSDGETFPVEVLLTAIQEGDRRVLHVVWRDITERKLLEESLRHSQKMDAVGKLAGGVAHDFNNLLVVILGHAEFLEDSVRTDPAAVDRLRHIRGAAKRAAGLVRHLLAFGRKQDFQPEVLDVSELVHELRPLMAQLAGADLPVTIDGPDSPLLVEADRGQIEQILLNLISNARDATPGRGEIRIRIHPVVVRDRTEGGKDGLEPGPYAVVSVADTGTGMEAGVMEKAFDPFFTTKGQEGTGLGLATAYGVARQSGGTLQIDSRVGEGTTIHVFLPTTEETPPAPREGADHDAGTGGTERLLVVEDEEGVRDLLVAALRAAGYDVRVAPDGVVGREVYEREVGEIDLVVSDVIMPGATGPEMLDALEARGYQPRILFLSGYTDDALTSKHRIRDGIDLLPKPFSVGQLLSRVRRALDAS